MKRLIMAVVVVLSVAVAACATEVPSSSTVAQKVCTIQDQQSGTCPSVRDATNAVIDALVGQYGAPVSRQVDCVNTHACAGAVYWWELFGDVECWEDISGEIICYTSVH